MYNFTECRFSFLVTYTAGPKNDLKVRFWDSIPFCKTGSRKQMSAELIQSYNEQVLSREPHELDQSVQQTQLGEAELARPEDFVEPQEVAEDKFVEDDQHQNYRSRNTSTSSSGHSSEAREANSHEYHAQPEIQPEEHELRHRELEKHPNPEREETSVIEVIKEEKLKVTETTKTREIDEVTTTTESKPTPKPLVKRDFPQAAPTSETTKSLEKDENDWALKNQGRGKINALIARFNNGAVLNESSDNTHQYKSDYGVGKGKGQLRQDVFQ
ncbi:unnamed protein product [Bursaphelenchus okinawaensis]|uniref:Uncharacterized protein n=1 Tax=Bursaphelenchus okinawaensis TaxID=465554 RepID=A0A811LID4_9BILA|nr:unnamed protein product [Bursaphelenchus okinawaensis]CAG9126426.1 unnamed protein product [Bursaphelenchus okinawaensis]